MSTKTKSKKILSVMSILSCASLLCFPFVNAAESVPVSVTITAGDVSIGIEDSTFTFASRGVSTSSQTTDGQFDGYFWVEDLKGDDAGYYTTVQMSGDLQSAANETIPGANVEMKITGDPDLITGSANVRVVTNSGIKGSYVSLGTPVHLIERNSATNNGVTGKYGVKPEMKLTIPAYQAVGNYTGTLVYTLYEN